MRLPILLYKHTFCLSGKMAFIFINTGLSEEFLTAT